MGGTEVERENREGVREGGEGAVGLSRLQDINETRQRPTRAGEAGSAFF